MKTNRHKITFEDTKDIEVIVLAQLGRSTESIREATGLSESQIQYRLHKAKTAEGYHKGHTYRSEWKSGTGEMAQAVANVFLPKGRVRVSRTLPPLFEHPTPEVSK